MNAIDIRAALRIIAAEIERGNHRSAERQIGKLIDSMPPETDALVSAAVDVCRYLDCPASNLLAVVTSIYESRAKAIDRLNAAAATTGAVGDLVSSLPVVEYMPDGARWLQRRNDRVRVWTDSEWTAAIYPPMVADDRCPARLVPADQADADPATRGPIGGGR